MHFEKIERQSLMVWLYTLKHLKTVRKYGAIHYISNRLKYVVLYVNKDQADKVMQELKKYHFVRNVEPSYRDTIDMTFKDAIPNRKDRDRQATTESSGVTLLPPAQEL